jgi:hypothetical protein
MDSGMVAESILPNLAAGHQMETPHLVVSITNRYVPQDSRLDTVYHFQQGEYEETRTHAHWVFTLRELIEMLRDAGLRTTATYGGINREEYAVGSPVLYLVAKKE